MKSSLKVIAVMAALIVVAIIALLIVSAVGAGQTQRYVTKAFMYHAVSDIPGENASLYVTPLEFEKQIAWLSDAGFTSVFADKFGTYGYKTAAITFDDGYENVYTEAFPILKKYNFKATVFLITSPAEGHITDEEIKEMTDSGLVMFGSHTDTHRDLTKLTPEEIRSELEASKSKIEKLTGKTVTTLSYPYGASDETVVSAAKKLGFKCAYTIYDPVGDEDKFHLPRYTVWRETKIDVFIKMTE